LVHLINCSSAGNTVSRIWRQINFTLRQRFCACSSAVNADMLTWRMSSCRKFSILFKYVLHFYVTFLETSKIKFFVDLARFFLSCITHKRLKIKTNVVPFLVHLELLYHLLSYGRSGRTHPVYVLKGKKCVWWVQYGSKI
jgi:hypothetical protein